MQVEDPSLSRFLEEEIERADPATTAAHARPVVSPFSANAIAAEQLLARAQTRDERGEPVALLQRIAADRPASLLLAGDHPLIDLLVLTLLRRQRAAAIERDESGAPPPATAVRISIYGPGAEERVLRLKERWRPEPQLLLLDGRDSAPPADGGAELDEWLRMPGRGDHAIVACVDQLEGIVLTLGVARALGGDTLVTRVSTVAPNALDEHVERHTASSEALATTRVESIAELGSDPERIQELVGSAASAAKRWSATPGADPAESARQAEAILGRRELAVRADRPGGSGRSSGRCCKRCSSSIRPRHGPPSRSA